MSRPIIAFLAAVTLALASAGRVAAQSSIDAGISDQIEHEAAQTPNPYAPALVILRRDFPGEWEALLAEVKADASSSQGKSVATTSARFMDTFALTRRHEAALAPADRIKALYLALAHSARTAARYDPSLCARFNFKGAVWDGRVAETATPAMEVSTAMMNAIRDGRPHAGAWEVMTKEDWSALNSALAAAGATEAQQKIIYSARWSSLPSRDQCDGRAILYETLAQSPDPLAARFMSNWFRPIAPPKVNGQPVHGLTSWMDTLQQRPFYAALRDTLPTQWHRVRVHLVKMTQESAVDSEVWAYADSVRIAALASARQSVGAAPPEAAARFYSRLNALALAAATAQQDACDALDRYGYVPEPAKALALANTLYETEGLGLAPLGGFGAAGSISAYPEDIQLLSEALARAGASAAQIAPLAGRQSLAKDTAMSCAALAHWTSAMGGMPPASAARAWADQVRRRDALALAAAIEGQGGLDAILGYDPIVADLRTAFPDEWSGLQRDLAAAARQTGSVNAVATRLAAFYDTLIKDHAEALARSPIGPIRDAIDRTADLYAAMQADNPAICARWILGVDRSLSADLVGADVLQRFKAVNDATVRALIAGARTPNAWGAYKPADEETLRQIVEDHADPDLIEALKRQAVDHYSAEQICAGAVAYFQSLSALPDESLGRYWSAMHQQGRSWAAPLPLGAGTPAGRLSAR